MLFRSNCVSIYYPATILSLFLSSLACGFSSFSFSLALALLSRAAAAATSRSTSLPPSTSYRRYVGCATSLPGNRYLAWLYTEWSSLYRCSPYTNFLRPHLLLVAATAAVSSLSRFLTRINDFFLFPFSRINKVTLIRHRFRRRFRTCSVGLHTRSRSAPQVKFIYGDSGSKK